MVVEDDAPQQAEQQEEGDEHEAHTPQQFETPTVASDAAAQHLETFLVSAAVNDGREGRVLRGAGKRGGYDEITRREKPRKRTGPRIRYVDEDERGGGTTEQGIRVGPVSVWRTTHGHRSRTRGAATPRQGPRIDSTGAVHAPRPQPPPYPTASSGLTIQHLLPGGEVGIAPRAARSVEPLHI